MELTDDRYGDPEVALNTGMILKEMLRYEPLAKMLLYSDQCVWGVGTLMTDSTRSQSISKTQRLGSPVTRLQT